MGKEERQTQNHPGGTNMHRVGARLRRRASTTAPEDGYFWAGVLVVFAFGMTLAAIDESWTRADWFWFTLFVHFEIALSCLYFWIVSCWLTSVDRTGD